MADRKLEIHKELIEQCRRNDRRAQYRLYKLYSKAMFNICQRMLANKLEAEDALQEAFIAAFKNLNKFRGESSFGAWIKRIVVNKCIDQVKRRQHLFVEIANPEEIQKLGNLDIEETVEIEESIDPAVVHEKIKELPEGARVIFNLHCLEGYKHREIAEMLDVTESTSKTQYQRARQLLRQMLQ